MCKCKILNPVSELKISKTDDWYIECFCGKIFISKPSYIIYNNVKSCGCLRTNHCNNLAVTRKRQDYYNLTTDFNTKIIEPLELYKNKCKDWWKCQCLHCGSYFEGRPDHLISGHTKSCGCLRSIKASQNAINLNKKLRIEKGLKENEFLSNENLLIRQNTFDLIKNIVMEIDNYTCNLCLQDNIILNLHHIIPFKIFFNKNIKETYNGLYRLDNLITLCKKCHKEKAHINPFEVDFQIQQELIEITKTRPINNKLLIQYENIVNTKILPWITKFHQG